MHWIDPAQLPQTKGVVERFLLNPHGELDGLILHDGTEVHFPPHLSTAVGKALKPAPMSSSTACNRDARRSSLPSRSRPPAIPLSTKDRTTTPAQSYPEPSSKRRA